MNPLQGAAELGTELQTTANRFLRFLDTPASAETTKVSSFDPAELNRGKVTVYLVLPPDHNAGPIGPCFGCGSAPTLRAVVRGGLGSTTRCISCWTKLKSLGHSNRWTMRWTSSGLWSPANLTCSNRSDN